MSAQVGDRVRVTAGEFARRIGQVESIAGRYATVRMPPVSNSGWRYHTTYPIRLTDLQRENTQDKSAVRGFTPLAPLTAPRTAPRTASPVAPSTAAGRRFIQDRYAVRGLPARDPLGELWA